MCSHQKCCGGAEAALLLPVAGRSRDTSASNTHDDDVELRVDGRAHQDNGLSLPASMKRVWGQNARSAGLPNVFRLAGLVPFDDWGGGAAEPAAWILDGDLTLGENFTTR